MKNLTIDNGIIDLERNPFTHESWIEQGFGFTSKRQNQIENLFGQTAENILMTQPENDNRYVAFVAICWGLPKSAIVSLRLPINGIIGSYIMVMANSINKFAFS